MLLTNATWLSLFCLLWYLQVTCHGYLQWLPIRVQDQIRIQLFAWWLTLQCLLNVYLQTILPEDCLTIIQVMVWFLKGKISKLANLEPKSQLLDLFQLNLYWNESWQDAWDLWSFKPTSSICTYICTFQLGDRCGWKYNEVHLRVKMHLFVPF